MDGGFLAPFSGGFERRDLRQWNGTADGVQFMDFWLLDDLSPCPSGEESTYLRQSRLKR